MPYLLTGWCWFLIALLPVIGLLQVGGQAMADRYSYLPSIGLFIAVVWGLNDLLEWLQRRTQLPALPATAIILTVAPLTILAFLAHRQVWYWKDTETLFAHSCDVTGPNPVACYALGTAEFARGDLQAALQNFTIAITQDPGNDKAAEYLGDIWLRFDHGKAIDYYQQAVVLKPDKASYRIALAAALTTSGDTASLNMAATQLRAAIAIDPTSAQARAGLADVQSRLRGKAQHQ